MKDIKGFEHRYAITSCGRGCSYLTHKFLKTPPDKFSGYLVVCLRDKNGKQHVKKVHRLVAEAYLENPNPFEFNQVGHKDENKLNNCVQNLEYTNATLNNQMPIRRARISNSVKNTKQISSYAIQCVETKELFNSYKEVAKKMNRAYPTVIADIKNGWALNGFHFILIDKS